MSEEAGGYVCCSGAPFRAVAAASMHQLPPICRDHRSVQGMLGAPVPGDGTLLPPLPSEMACIRAALRYDDAARDLILSLKDGDGLQLVIFISQICRADCSQPVCSASPVPSLALFTTTFQPVCRIGTLLMPTLWKRPFCA